jgi:hypothetical protein
MARRADRHRVGVTRWLILRTSAGRTLALAASLGAAGHGVWTPKRTLRRSLKAKTVSGTRLIEIEVAILPTFVFASEHDLEALAELAIGEGRSHPAFSVFRTDGRIPIVGDGEIAGLRAEEAREAATIQAIRDAETYAEAERIRISAIKSDAARRRAERALERDRRHALRSQTCSVEPGAAVEVIDTPALVGVRGVFERADGPYAHVRFGAHSWKIEGWRVLPAALNDNKASRGVAA